MLSRAFLAGVVYVVGGIGLLYWSISGFAAGAPREDWALMLVLPAAWIISFWPMFGSLVMISKVRTLQSTLERVAETVKAHEKVDPNDLEELEDVVVKMVAQENRLPEFVVRPFVRKVGARIVKDGASRAGDTK